MQAEGAWADNAINLAVQMTVACIQRDLWSAGQQATGPRRRVLFPEAVMLVRGREGLT